MCTGLDGLAVSLYHALMAEMPAMPSVSAAVHVERTDGLAVGGDVLVAATFGTGVDPHRHRMQQPLRREHDILAGRPNTSVDGSE